MKKLIRFFKNQDKRMLMFMAGGMLLMLLITLLIIFKPFSSGKHRTAFEVIPDNAFVVFRVNNPGEMLASDSYKSVCENLAYLPSVSSFLFGLRQADTVFSVTENFKELLFGSHLYLSLHPTGKEKIEILFVLELPENMEAMQLYDEVNSSGKVPLAEKDIERKPCYSIGKKPFNLYPCGNLIIGSVSEKLLGLSITASEKKSGLSKNDDFMQASSTSTTDCAINILVNTPLLYRSLGLIVSGETYVNMAFLQTFTTWGNMDVKIQNNALVLSGLFPLKKGSTSFITLFEESHGNATSQILSMLPVNTSAAFSFGFNQYNKFFSAYCRRLLKEQQNVYDNEEEIAHLNEEAGTESLESCIYKHINGLLCVFSTTANPGQEPSVFCGFPVNDATEINDCLKNYAEENEWDTMKFRNATIYEIPVEYGAYSLFGPLFEPISETYITVTDSFVYIGSSVDQLKPLLNNILSGRTLGSSRFKESLNNNISSSWNTFAFMNTSATLFYLQNRWLSDTTLISSCNNAQRNQQTGILSLTCARQVDGIVVSGTWIFDRLDSTDSYSWATALDADISGNPVILKDSKTNEYWIVAADVYDNLYLLNSEGVIVWKKTPGDAIHSDFQLLYMGKPDKRSIAFSTRKAIYIIGMNGEMLKSFPVTISGGLSSNLLAADYDNNQNYRLLFCDNSNLLNNYSTDGKQTPGWIKPDTKLGRESHVFYSPLGDKDFLVVINPDNVAVVYNRKGKEVTQINGAYYNKGLPSFFGGSDKTAWTVMSEDGSLLSVDANGNKKMLSEKSFGENFIYTVAGNLILIINDGELFVLDAEGTEKSNKKLADSGIDYIKTVNNEGEWYLIFHTNNNVLGITGVVTDFAENKIKSDVQAFDCISYKGKLVLITSQGKTVVSETVPVTASKTVDD